MQIIPPRKCTAKSTTTGERCDQWAVIGAAVCVQHGASAPQVRIAATRRVTLAEALANSDRRHPLEVLADALHGADVLARQTLAALTGEDPISGEMVQAWLEITKTQATMAKLVLDAAGPDGWSNTEAVRSQADALAWVCREMARQLGHDPASDEVTAAFEAALAGLRGGRRVRGRAQSKAIEAKVIQ